LRFLCSLFLHRQGTKTEGERRRKQLESQLSELSARLAESERGRGEGSERQTRLQSELESVTAQLVEADSKLTIVLKSQTSLEQQLIEVPPSHPMTKIFPGFYRFRMRKWIRFGYIWDLLDSNKIGV